MARTRLLWPTIHFVKVTTSRPSPIRQSPVSWQWHVILALSASHAQVASCRPESRESAPSGSAGQGTAGPDQKPALESSEASRHRSSSLALRLNSLLAMPTPVLSPDSSIRLRLRPCHLRHLGINGHCHWHTDRRLSHRISSLSSDSDTVSDSRVTD